MERRLSRMSNQLVLISGAVCAVVFCIGLLRRHGLVEMLKMSISLAVAAVPEGLPTVATTTLAVGIRTMRNRKVIITSPGSRRDAGGPCRTVCFDKTGTVTENRMAVQRVFTGMRTVVLNGHDGDGAFTCDAHALDPLDVRGNAPTASRVGSLQRGGSGPGRVSARHSRVVHGGGPDPHGPPGRHRSGGTQERLPPAEDKSPFGGQAFHGDPPPVSRGRHLFRPQREPPGGPLLVPMAYQER